MKIELNRGEIEKAIDKYIEDEYLKDEVEFDTDVQIKNTGKRAYVDVEVLDGSTEIEAPDLHERMGREE